MRKPVEEKWPLNTIKPYFRVPRLLNKIHKLQGATLGNVVAIPRIYAYFINNDITITEVCDRCHAAHGDFLRAFPVTADAPDWNRRYCLRDKIKKIYGISDFWMFTDAFFKWDRQLNQLVEVPDYWR
jgi:hypothetical protein